MLESQYISETFFPAHSASLVYYLPHASGESAEFPTGVNNVLAWFGGRLSTLAADSGLVSHRGFLFYSRSTVTLTPPSERTRPSTLRFLNSDFSAP
jgi:hypothetical protein